MKLDKVKLGMVVTVKSKRAEDARNFFDEFLGRTGTVVRIDLDGDVHVRFEDESQDFGNHVNIKRVRTADAYKVGTKVKLRKGSRFNDGREDNPIGVVGTVLRVKNTLNPLVVQWPNGTENSYYPEDLKIVEYVLPEE